MSVSLDAVERYLFNEGSNAYSYRFLGCHLLPESKDHYRFAVWAPHAKAVSLVGEWNDWNPDECPMEKADDSIWAIEIEGVAPASLYKYAILTFAGDWIFKADPYAVYSELRPGTASRVWSLDDYQWNDSDWLEKRRQSSPYAQPVSIYEMHLASWRGEMNYRDIADELVPYLIEMGYTHVEFMPLSEYPYDASWGYQVTGYFSATARYGEPQDLMYLVDQLHQAGIACLMDWVPAHFPRDNFGLRLFDGSPCYEYPDALRGEHPQWGTMIFNYSAPEVRSFLLSSAVFWLDKFHFDGLRADAVSSMLYYNYGRENGHFAKNKDGGVDNYEAISFLQKCSQVIFQDFPGTIFSAEESSSFPQVTHPVALGGLGFNYKWNMGWMHDMLDYMSLDPYFRSKNHSRLTFSMFYAFSENFILPLSHDEVVHGKKSLLNKMPGDIDEKFANLRVFLSYMFAHPGKKLMFMGVELGEFIEWRFDEPLEWFLLEYDNHKKLQQYIARLNAFYRNHPALYEIEDSWDGFCWLNVDDADHSVLSLARFSKGGKEQLVAVFNFTPVAWESYQLGVPQPGHYRQIFSSLEEENPYHNDEMESTEHPLHNQNQSIDISLPPFGGLYFAYRPFTEKEICEHDLQKNKVLCQERLAYIDQLQKDMEAFAEKQSGTLKKSVTQDKISDAQSATSSHALTNDATLAEDKIAKQLASELKEAQQLWEEARAQGKILEKKLETMPNDEIIT